MADANQTWGPETLALIAGDLAAAGLGWLEEPYPVDDAAAYRDWPHGAAPPLALGENLYGLAAFGEATQTLKPAVVQPDITKTGGFSEGQRIGAAIVADGRRFCPHMNGGLVGLYASAHLAAAVPGSDLVEMDANPNSLFGLFGAPPRIEDGDLLLPPGPGLGLALTAAARERAQVISR